MVLFVCYGLILVDDFADGSFVVIGWDLDFGRLKVVDEADDETVSLVILALVPGDELSLEKFIPLVVLVGATSDEGSAWREEDEARSYEGYADYYSMFRLE